MTFPGPSISTSSGRSSGWTYPLCAIRRGHRGCRRRSDTRAPVSWMSFGAETYLCTYPTRADASVERFIQEGAADPKTLAIKMTVYRVGDDTPFVKSLVNAAEAGKQVACVIELQARFDENRNLHWADELFNVGASVSFGVL